jgi:hypothetical protein
MLNRIFNFPSITINNTYQFDNVFVYDKSAVYSIVDANSHMFYTKVCQDDEKLEALAYKEYNDSSLWDVLFVINKMKSVYDLPKNQDIVYSESVDYFNEWKAKFPYIQNQQTLDNIFKAIHSRKVTSNEKYRVIRYIYPDYLTVFLDQVKNVFKSA